MSSGDGRPDLHTQSNESVPDLWNLSTILQTPHGSERLCVYAAARYRTYSRYFTEKSLSRKRNSSDAAACTHKVAQWLLNVCVIILFYLLHCHRQQKGSTVKAWAVGGRKERKLRNFKREVEFYVNVVACALAMMLMYNEKIHYFFMVSYIKTHSSVLCVYFFVFSNNG